MSRRRLFMSLNHPPVVPPSYDVMAYNTLGTSSGAVSTRQLALEPSVAGADRAMSWSGWINPHNVGTGLFRVFGVNVIATSFQQYSLNIQSQSQATLNQLLSFTIFNTANTAHINIYSTNKLLRARWSHVVITYDGSETAAGLKMYLNGAEDTTANKFTTGTYTGAGNDAAYRMQTSCQPGSRFRGKQRDFAIWNRVLTAGEVLTLYNGGVPYDVNTASFYASAIEAYWPLRTAATCLNNATFNFINTLMVSVSTPVGPLYQDISVFNAIPGNTAYVAFGSIYKVDSNNFVWNGRSGTDHITAGNIVKVLFNKNGNFTVGAPVTILNETDDMRNAAAAITDGSDITIFSNRYNTATLTVIDNNWYKSTDGITGEAFGSRNDIASILPISDGITYGKMVPGYVAGEYFVGWYGITAATTYYVGVLKRSAAGVWSYIPIYQGTTKYVEMSIVRAGENTFLGFARLDAGVGVHMVSSIDGGATWGSFAATGLGSGVCMGDAVAMPNTGNIVLVYADRGASSDGVFVSSRNILSDILADPTDWNTASQIFQKYTYGSNILGYPVICADGYFVAIALSVESSATRADLYMSYGQVDF